jgi:hypothetical protein
MSIPGRSDDHIMTRNMEVACYGQVWSASVQDKDRCLKTSHVIATKGASSSLPTQITIHLLPVVLSFHCPRDCNSHVVVRWCFMFDVAETLDPLPDVRTRHV